MSRRILVTGAFGFLGRYVARRWASEGWHVTGLGHGEWVVEDWRKWGMDEWFAADINAEALMTYAGKPDLIVHCAGSGSVSFSVSHPFQDFERTTLTMAAVLEYVRLYSPATRVVYPSSAAVYGAVHKFPIYENADIDPVSPYGVHKYMAEDLCRSYAKNYSISVSIVRFFSIYGNGLRKQLLWDACCKLSSGYAKFAGTGKELRDWIHVSDAAELLVTAALEASHKCPVINGGSGSSTSVREIVSRLAKLFPNAESNFTGASRSGDPEHYQADITFASALGWRPRVDIDQGIELYAEWFKSGAV